MTTAMSKRTQMRNERALQELVKTVPGNDRCADCAARNPGWASWSLGIFLCMRCASLHRKLGTHISKVKSLSMDSWSNDQVESMRRNGNATSNRLYNPRNSKPAIPLDVDEVDTALERFIRQKYDQQTLSGGAAVRPAVRQDTGTSASTRSSEDQPPPLPPKPGKRFGFGLRSVSSALPMTRHSHISPPTSPDTANGYPPSPPIQVNKQSRVFGASVGGGGENMEAKLATLRDMGFGDERRNTAILKGLNGNLERTIETLVRLGDGNAPASRPRSPARTKPVASSQPFSSVGVEPPHAGNTAKINPPASTQPKHDVPNLPQPDADSSNSVPQQTESRPYNPFDAPSSRSDTWPLERNLENLQLSQPQPQPLFPNATGGYPIQPDHVQANRLQQSMTPPVPQLHQPIHSNPYVQQMASANGHYNPFFQTPQQGQTLPNNFNTPSYQAYTNGNAYNNPFMASQPSHQPYDNNNLMQSPQSLVSQTVYEQQQQQNFTPNQGQSVDMQYQHPLDQYSPQSQLQYPHFTNTNPYQPQPLQAQPTGRFDKSSILALYNYPHLAPPSLPHSIATENQAPTPEYLATSPIHSKPRGSGQRSVTMPAQLAAGSRNPFLTAQSNNAAAASNNSIPAIPSSLSRHASQESVDVGSYHHGRESPDAFASLSARFVR